MWKCRDCNEEIDHLIYTVPVSTTEYGSAYLDDRNSKIKEITATTRMGDIIDDYNYDDRGDAEWDGDITYNCPECDYEYSHNEIPIPPALSEKTKETKEILAEINPIIFSQYSRETHNERNWM